MAIVTIAYNSVYFKKLDEVKASGLRKILMRMHMHKHSGAINLYQI
jgi:hypothetical protein